MDINRKYFSYFSEYPRRSKKNTKQKENITCTMRDVR